MDTETPRVYNFALPTVYEKFYLNKIFFFIIKYILKETMTLNALKFDILHRQHCVI